MVNIQRINSRMNELKMTKAQLIKDSGLTRVTIDKVLSGGKINVDTLEALAKGLGVSVGFFFDDYIAPNEQVQIGGTRNNQAGASINNNSVSIEEHDELIRLRVEVKMLQERIEVSQKSYDILHKSYEQLQKMNDFLMGQK